MQNTKKRIFFTLAAATMLLGIAACQSAQPTPPPQPDPGPPPPAITTVHHWPTRASTDRSLNWTMMAYPTGTASTSVVGIEKGMPRQVNLNHEFEYLLILTNLTSNDLTDVSLTENYGPHFEMVSATPAPDVKRDTSATWAIGAMAPRESRTIRVRGKGSQTGNIASCASVSYASLLCMSVPVVSPELRIALEGPTDVLRCENIAYTIRVTNPGTGTVENVRVRHPLPDGLTTMNGEKIAEFNVGVLNPDQTQTFTVPVLATRTGTFENKSHATGGGLTAESGTVRTVVRAPKLEIKRECPEMRYMGRNMEISINVRNTGNGVARDLVVEDTIPSGAQVVSVGQDGRVVGNRIVWRPAALNPDASLTLTAVLRPTAIGSYAGTSSATAFCADAVNASCTTRVEGIPALLLEGFDDPDPIEVGNNTTYTLIVTNQGSADLTGVKLTGMLDEGQTMSFVSAEGATPAGAVSGSADGRRINFPTLARLAPGQRATYRVTVRADKPGQASFRAEAVSNEITRPLIKIETTNFY